jgi:hypothetical protein
MAIPLEFVAMGFVNVGIMRRPGFVNLLPDAIVNVCWRGIERLSGA